MRISALSLAAFMVLAVAVEAERVEPVFVRETIGVQAAAAPPHQADGEPPLAALAAARDAVPGEIAAVQDWNDQGNRPAKNGFTRSIGGTLAIRVAPAEAPTNSVLGHVAMSNRGTTVWAGSIRVAGAYRLRIHLQNVVAPPGTRFWVYGDAGSAIAFGTELIDDRADLYTPSVEGELAHLEMELPAGSPGASFDLTDVVELVGPLTTLDTPNCLIDATCVTSSTLDAIDLFRRAVAQLEYVKDGGSFVCTGGLLNDRDDSSFVPYLLTANHCFSTQASATSLEAHWDFKTATCAGVFPSIASSPRSNGSTLLATSPGSDFTFVRMNSVPSGRVFLGWDTRAPAAGTMLYRISHPFPDSFAQPSPQSYSTTIVSTTSSTCTGKSRPDFIYSTTDDGGTYGGSSGSPVILSGGITVGQLYGACGPEPSAGCNASNFTIDGAFAQTYPSVSEYLSGGGGGGGATVCTPSSTTLCLNDGRFRVTATFLTPQGQSGNANAVTETSATGLFWFFSADNVEAIIKVVNGCTLNSRYWVFAGGLTNVQVSLTVTDTRNGTTRTYTNPQGVAFQPVQDTNAFATCP